MKTKTIKLIKRDGSLMLSTTGDNYKVIELCTCCIHDFVTYQSDTVLIHVAA